MSRWRTWRIRMIGYEGGPLGVFFFKIFSLLIIR